MDFPIKNPVIYKNNCYVQDENVCTVCNDKRLSIFSYTFKPYSQLPKDLKIKQEDTGLLLSPGLHGNPGHSMWDCIYPAWYTLLFFEKIGQNFIFLVTDEKYKKYMHGWSLKDLIKRMSSNEIHCFETLTREIEAIQFPWIIYPLNGIGLGCVDKNFCIITGLNNENNIDYVQKFVDNVYKVYKIERTIWNKNKNINKKIIYAKNKRNCNGIEELFTKMKINNYTFQIIDWSHYNFEQQLRLLNETAILVCGVGTVRTNSPFLPVGSIELQTNTHDIKLYNNINFFDCQTGTLTTSIMVYNIEDYSKEEVTKQQISSKLKDSIEHCVNVFPCSLRETNTDNLPKFVVENILPILTTNNHKKWKNEKVNDVTYLYRFLPKPFYAINVSVKYVRATRTRTRTRK